MHSRTRKGTSLIDLIISIAILAMLFGGVYLVYFSIVTAITNIGARDAAATVMGIQLETVRNLPYGSVGTVGGVPAGIIPQVQTVSSGKYTFSVQTTIRNIDDPFDGTLGGNPNDNAPADYKLVAITTSCPLCVNFVPLTVTTTVAPKNLESATLNGSIFISVLDANGVGIPEATMQVVNASVTPSINLTDTTNASGVLQLIGVPTSTQGYQIFASKAGYSSDQTYPPGAAGNPNPIKPNATVALQTVTNITLAIDRTSALTVKTSDNRCNAIAGEPFSIAGSKLIGVSPNVLKFSTSSATSASGSRLIQNIEWDTYTLTSTDVNQNVAGTIPLSPLAINPSSTPTFRFILQSASNPALLATVIDAATGAAIPNAVITLSKGAFSKTLSTNHATITDTNWSAGNYTAKDPGIDADSLPGKLTLAVNASGTYTTGTTATLTSNTFDVGGSSSTFYGFSWNPVSQLSMASLTFQVAANNDQATWNFVGPGGAGNTFFSVSTSSLSGLLDGNRYFRYKVYMSTQDETVTPELDDISLDFTADCVPPAQALFQGLALGTYTLDATAANYIEGTTTVAVAPGFQSAVISLTHL